LLFICDGRCRKKILQKFSGAYRTQNWIYFNRCGSTLSVGRAAVYPLTTDPPPGRLIADTSHGRGCMGGPAKPSVCLRVRIARYVCRSLSVCQETINMRSPEASRTVADIEPGTSPVGRPAPASCFQHLSFQLLIIVPWSGVNTVSAAGGRCVARRC